MSRVGELLGSRRTPHWAVLALVSVGFGGCSADTQTRFTDNPNSFKTSWSNWSNPFSSTKPALEATGSVPQQNAQPRELPQYARPRTNTSAPVVSAPLSYPTTPVAQTGGGRGMASYSPSTTSPIESTGSVKPRSVAATPNYKPEGGTTIIVGTSDTLDIIAKRYNVPASDILAANDYGGPRVLQPGQQLIIPKRNVAASQPVISAPATTPVAKPMTTAASSVHVVNPGDTLSNIARRNHITPGQLAAANNLPVTSQLKIGSKITVPGGKVAAVAAPEVKPPVVAQAPVAKPAVVAAAPVEPAQKAALASDKIETPESPVKAADATNGLPSFRWPVRGRVITTYGAKTNGKSNDGINVAVPEGTPVKAAEDGVVAYSGNELKGYGNLILVRHANGYVTAYAHASELMVKRGDTIKRGQIIAKSGQTGEVGSPQLHFEIRKGSSAVDPLQFLNGA